MDHDVLGRSLKVRDATQFLGYRSDGSVWTFNAFKTKIVSLLREVGTTVLPSAGARPSSFAALLNCTELAVED